MADTTERNFRKVRRGYVVSEAMDKTITVELEQPFDPPAVRQGRSLHQEGQGP